MNSQVIITLTTTPEQRQRLESLQAEFAAACNLVAPVAQANRCWNRVALHHLTYRAIRERFPQLGSQMACNAVYSVARTYRIVLGHPQSPWNLDKRPGRPIPALAFQGDAPVYFDRHTLSVRGAVLSMFSLDGRLRFELGLSEPDRHRFANAKLREIVLRRHGGAFVLGFLFADVQSDGEQPLGTDLPEYVVITDAVAIPQSSAVAAEFAQSGAA